MHFYIMQQLAQRTETMDHNKAEQQYKELTAINTIFEQKGGSLY
jgi:hypothetical protein